MDSVDGAVNGVGKLVNYGSRQLRLLQSGQVCSLYTDDGGSCLDFIHYSIVCLTSYGCQRRFNYIS